MRASNFAISGTRSGFQRQEAKFNPKDVEYVKFWGDWYDPEDAYKFDGLPPPTPSTERRLCLIVPAGGWGIVLRSKTTLYLWARP